MYGGGDRLLCLSFTNIVFCIFALFHRLNFWTFNLKELCCLSPAYLAIISPLLQPHPHISLFFPFSFPTLSPIFISPCLSFPLLSEIPAVSLCPPDSECSAEAQLTIIQSEGELCDSCSSLGRPSSSCQLYHQVCPSTVCTVHCLGLVFGDPLKQPECLKKVRNRSRILEAVVVWIIPEFSMSRGRFFVCVFYILYFLSSFSSLGPPGSSSWRLRFTKAPKMSPLQPLWANQTKHLPRLSTKHNRSPCWRRCSG